MIQSFLFSLLFAFCHPGLAAPETPALPTVRTYDGLLHAIRETRAASQARIEAAVEEEKVREAWETGKLIQEHILLNQSRAEYGAQVLKRLSADLGLSETELGYMVEFARAYPISQPAGKLSWSHYASLLAINDSQKRKEVEEEAVRGNWTRQRLREEIKRRRLATAEELAGELPEITPGPLDTYKIIRLKERLKIDLGFGLYLDLPEKDAKKFKEGDIVEITSHLSLVTASLSPANLFTYRATVTQVVDGDTFHALIDLGFGVTLAQRVRLRRIDAPEIVSAEGKEAKAYLEKILSRDHGRILMKSIDIDQHGRPIADVWVKGEAIDQELLDQGLAVAIQD